MSSRHDYHRPGGGWVVVDMDDEGGQLHSQQPHLHRNDAETERQHAAIHDPTGVWEIVPVDVWHCRCTWCGSYLDSTPRPDYWQLIEDLHRAGWSTRDTHPTCPDCLVRGRATARRRHPEKEESR